MLKKMEGGLEWRQAPTGSLDSRIAHRVQAHDDLAYPPVHIYNIILSLYWGLFLRVDYACKTIFMFWKARCWCRRKGGLVDDRTSVHRPSIVMHRSVADSRASNALTDHLPSTPQPCEVKFI